MLATWRSLTFPSTIRRAPAGSQAKAAARLGKRAVPISRAAMARAYRAVAQVSHAARHPHAMRLGTRLQRRVVHRVRGPWRSVLPVELVFATDRPLLQRFLRHVRQCHAAVLPRAARASATPAPQRPRILRAVWRNQARRAASGAVCSDSSATCDATSTCVACGAAGEPCCGGTTCATGAMCQGSACVACGGPGEPCCAGSAMCTGGLTCTSGTCGGCSAPSQPCCAGSACATGATCNLGQCARCGGRLRVSVLRGRDVVEVRRSARTEQPASRAAEWASRVARATVAAPLSRARQRTDVRRAVARGRLAARGRSANKGLCARAVRVRRAAGAVSLVARTPRATRAPSTECGDVHGDAEGSDKPAAVRTSVPRELRVRAGCASRAD